ncbi:MAG TPA: cytochrome c oxidase assembly protein [Solirubrobacteraceae bacterium]|jgi:putative membrane protein|nr:cytochrome c oxidase assembly protein [Solirubrobacteraceae bacterium]
MPPLIPPDHTLPIAAALALEDTVQIVPVALLMGVYARRARALAGSEERVPRWRQACFHAGCLTIAGALLGLSEVGEQLLVAHMVQLLLIGVVAALLLVLGLTAPILLADQSTASDRRSAEVFGRLRVLTNPLIALPMWAVCVSVWHLPGPYQSALEHPGVHVLQHATLLACGVNLWMCLFGPLPAPGWFGNLGRLLYIAAVGLLAAALGNLLLWSDVVFYPFYLDGDSAHSVSPIADQNLAGAVLVIEATLLTIGLFGWLFVRTAREAREREALLELASAHGLSLSDKRAARAVSTGRGAELRQRLEGRIEAERVSAPPTAAPDTIL